MGRRQNKKTSQSKAKLGRGRNTIIYVVSEKVFWRSPRRSACVCEGNFRVMNEKGNYAKFIDKVLLIDLGPRLCWVQSFNVNHWSRRALISQFFFVFLNFRAEKPIRCAARTTSLITRGVTWWKTPATLASTLKSSMKVRAHHDTSSSCSLTVERLKLAMVRIIA